MAFCEYHSGAPPPSGKSSIPHPNSLAILAPKTKILELSTQEPICNAGGIFKASQTERKPSPASLADSGINNPAFPPATPPHPVTKTRISRFINSLVNSTNPKSCLILGLLHPTRPTTPLIFPATDRKPPRNSRGTTVSKDHRRPLESRLPRGVHR